MSTLVAQTISNGTISTSTANVINGAKAWVNFNGTGTPAIRAQYNVSSVTKNTTGDFTLNFTNALADVNYSVAGAANQDTNGWGTVEVSGVGTITTMTTTQLRIRTIGYTTYFDPVLVCVNIFR
jgi:hypothetical protein